MTPGGRLSAAIEVFAGIAAQRRPASDALAEWGRAHRFAGSKDRAAIAAFVYDALRRRASSAWTMGADEPRAVLLGSLRLARELSAEAIAALCSGDAHAPPPLTDEERTRLDAADLDGAPPHVAGDFPEWLAPHIQAAFGDSAVLELTALAARAPVDLRANTLKTSREKVLADLSHLGAGTTPHAPHGLRIAIGSDGRAPALAAERAFIKGNAEIQDEGSQLAALLAGAAPGEQVLDFCAGGGGKSLAMAAQMNGRGQIYATDADGRRLAPIFARLERAGARNVQVRMPKGKVAPLDDLRERCDLVLVDAPCTGSGIWRRNPDAKWRIRPGALEQRMHEQDAALRDAAAFVRPGGRLAYVTCSLLREENEDRVAAFLTAEPGFAPVAAEAMCAKAGLSALAPYASSHGPGLRLTPARTGTDGFYVCVLTRAG